MAASDEEFEEIREYLPDQDGKSVVVRRINGKLSVFSPEAGVENDKTGFGDQFTGELLMMVKQLDAIGNISSLFVIALWVGGCWYLWKFQEIRGDQWFILVGYAIVIFMLFGHYIEMRENSIFKIYMLDTLTSISQRLEITPKALLSKLNSQQGLKLLAEKYAKYLTKNDPNFIT